jgi:RepB plasmid partitioning protein/ParB-like nuclease family protein
VNRSGFERNTIKVPIEDILPTRVVLPTIRHSPKFKTILASMQDVGIIEPLAVFREGADENGKTKYILLDGHLRLEALKVLGATEALCLISTDDEGFTYNRQINRLSAIQEHRMIIQAIEKNVPPERIAKALNVNVQRIRERQRLLDGIAPETVDILKERMVSHGVFSVLRKMKPIRQIEAAEMMISANRFSVPYATMILVATRSEFLVDPQKLKKTDASPENIARMEREMEKLYQDYKAVEDTLGETMLVLVVAKGYVARLLRNEAILTYLRRHYDDLTQEMGKIMDAVGVDARSAERE